MEGLVLHQTQSPYIQGLVYLHGDTESPQYMKGLVSYKRTSIKPNLHRSRALSISMALLRALHSCE